MLRAREVWPIAGEVAAVAYGVEPALVIARSRGRGPRPPRDVWGARKVAVYVTVVISGATYAEVGRAIGLHRDTVASHCAELRDALTEERPVAEAVRVATAALSLRLDLMKPPEPSASRPQTPAERVDAIERHICGVFGELRRALSDEAGASSDTSDKSRIRYRGSRAA